MRQWITVIFSLFLISCGPATPSETPQPENEKPFILSLPRDVWELQFPDLPGEINIFLVDEEGTEFQPLVTGLNGNNFVEGFSPDGQQMMVSSFASLSVDEPVFGDLYLVAMDGSSTVKLTDGFQWRLTSSIAQAAYWLPNMDEIIFIATENGRTDIFAISPDGSSLHPLFSTNRQTVHPPLLFWGYTENSLLFWQNGLFDGDSITLEHAIWKGNLTTGETISLQKPGEILSHIAVSPTTGEIVWGNQLFDQEGVALQQLPLEKTVVSASWSPDGEQLLMVACSHTSCDTDLLEFYLWSLDDEVRSFALEGMYSPLLARWSPDQQQILLVGADAEENVSSVVLSVNDGTHSIVLTPIAEEFLFGTNWNPHYRGISQE